METHREDEDVTKVTKEFYVIKLNKGGEEYFWTESSKVVPNYTSELRLAKKYKSIEAARKMALKICGVNTIFTYVVRYTTLVRTTYLEECIPFRTSKESYSLTIYKD